MKIRELELLVRVARTGSMTQAAQQLHLTPGAVSAAVGRIEEELGVRLFERTTRSLRPTEDGLVVLQGCEEVLARWRSTLDDLRRDDEIEGTVHLSAPVDTTYQLLEGVLVALSDAHPGLRVQVHTGDSVRHLHRDAIDMAIRYGAIRDGGVIKRLLTHQFGVLVASPGYLERHGAPREPEELAAHRCLTLPIGGAPRRVWPLERGGEVYEVEIDSPLCSDGHLSRVWAVEGRGIALKSLFDVLDDLEAGRLVRVLPGYAAGPYPIHAVFPSRRFLSARVRVVDEAITALFEARVARCQRWLDEHEPRLAARARARGAAGGA
jgi:DNA-binding transcriptional LysR family regulator